MIILETLKAASIDPLIYVKFIHHHHHHHHNKPLNKEYYKVVNI